MSNRPLLSESSVHSNARATMATFHHDVVREVEVAIKQYPVVIVGMRQNPVVRKARKLLTDAGVAFHYLEYGSYLSAWKPRLAIKLWSGWPTFPQVFVRGTLVGGAADLQKLLASDELKKLL